MESGLCRRCVDALERLREALIKDRFTILYS